VIAVSSGGKMGATARTDGFPCYGLPSGYPPRSALGYSLGVLLQAFDAFGVKAVSKQDLHKAAEFLDGESRKFTDLRRKDNPAMAISRLLVGRFPLLVAEEGSMEPVGFRWKCQLNENSKIHASFMPVPEMCHNEIVGWKRLAATQAYYKSLIAVALRSPDEHPRVRLRLNIIQDLVVKNKGKAIDVQVKGATPFERMLYGIHLGDVVSLYLAARNGADPTEIDNIDTLKHKLGQ
jgi:glucose/mannose-6-phosphate isomerase